VLSTSEASPAPTDASRYLIHTVVAGETLWSISQRYPGTTVDDLIRLNPQAEHLQAGATLRIPQR
jgi:LysM repeat protein